MAFHVIIGCYFVFQGDAHPIVPVMLGDARLASDFADDMLEKGIYVIGFSFPVVPKGERLGIYDNPLFLKACAVSRVYFNLG